MQDCIGVTYTATQSTLELFKLEVDYSINFVSAKVKNCIGVTYKATQSILELFKLEVNYSSTLYCLYNNSLNTGTISAKVQDCIGVAYTSTQSILEVFKLEVNYSSTLFQQNCKIARLHRSYLYSNSINTGTI